MHRLALLLAILLVIPLFGSDSPKDYDDRTGSGGIEGTWRLIEWEYNGKKSEPDFPCKKTYRSGNLISDTGDGHPLRSTYRIDTTRKPPYLDEMPLDGNHKGLPYMLIYQIDGDTLKIAYRDLVQRQQKFDDKDLFISTYKRVK